jgi:hypothetical protein
VKALRQRAASRQAADHDPVEVVDLRGDPLPAELLGAGDAVAAHLVTQLVVVEDARDRGRDPLGFARLHEQGLPVAADDALVAVDVRRHDRRACRHRLEQHDAERLAAGRRGDVHVRGPEELGLLVVADPAQELDPAQPSRRHVAPCLARMRPLADDEQPAVAAGLAQDPVRLEELEQALARLVPPHEQQVALAVLPASDRHGPLEPGDVDAVGDDLVLAGK